MNTRIVLGGLLLAASTTLFAQAPGGPPDHKGGPPGRAHAEQPCAKAPDPAKCEARRKEHREQAEQARAACKDKHGPDQALCMASHRCAKAPDPAKCESRAKEHVKERMEHRREMREKDGAKPAPAPAPKS